jgi:hypothetical protein
MAVTKLSVAADLPSALLFAAALITPLLFAFFLFFLFFLLLFSLLLFAALLLLALLFLALLGLTLLLFSLLLFALLLFLALLLLSLLITLLLFAALLFLALCFLALCFLKLRFLELRFRARLFRTLRFRARRFRTLRFMTRWFRARRLRALLFMTWRFLMRRCRTLRFMARRLRTRWFAALLFVPRFITLPLGAQFLFPVQAFKFPFFPRQTVTLKLQALVLRRQAFKFQSPCAFIVVTIPLRLPVTRKIYVIDFRVMYARASGIAGITRVSGGTVVRRAPVSGGIWRATGQCQSCRQNCYDKARMQPGHNSSPEYLRAWLPLEPGANYPFTKVKLDWC